MAEENERRPAVERAGIAGNLPAPLNNVAMVMVSSGAAKA
jgi:hypothetical protein